ncbi:MAG: phosphoadenosine phosphosulfate reductase family protein [Thermofilaceae archaeon]
MLPTDRLKHGLGARAHRILARVGARIFWCDNCNVPLLTRFCGLCKHEGRPVKVTPPADARPALGVDYVHLWELIRSELGSIPYPRRRIVLLNKIPYPDVAEEVVVDGYVVGHRYYDVMEKRWRFKPIYVGVSALIKEGMGYYAIVDLPTLVRNYEIHRDKIIEASLPSRRERRFIALATRSGVEGVGVLTERGWIRVLKSWKAKRYQWNGSNPTWVDAVKANESRLSLLEQEAVDFLRGVASKTGFKPIVSFSGGKDSLVAYRLAEKAFGKVPILFNDTGLELPETVEYVKSFAKRVGAELILADAGKAFWSSLNVMGPPARDYRWCCKVCKLVPTARAIKERLGGEVLSIVGQRRYESAARALSPRVYRNKWIPMTLVAAPIQDWSALDVWLFIFKEKLTVNNLYFKGFDRLGCWLCPAIELGEIDRLKKVKPELWRSWEKVLNEYAKACGYGDDWVKLGLWRWVNPPGDIIRLAGGETRAERVRPIAVKTKEGGFTVEIRKPNASTDLTTLIGLLSTIGKVEYSSSGFALGKALIEVRQGHDRLVVEIEGEADVWKIASSVARALLCLNCGSCVLWCPTGAVKLEEGRLKVDASKCTRCGVCHNVCPLSEYLVRPLLNSKQLQEA